MFRFGLNASLALSGVSAESKLLFFNPPIWGTRRTENRPSDAMFTVSENGIEAYPKADVRGGPNPGFARICPLLDRTTSGPCPGPTPLDFTVNVVVNGVPSLPVLFGLGNVRSSVTVPATRMV